VRDKLFIEFRLDISAVLLCVGLAHLYLREQARRAGVLVSRPAGAIASWTGPAPQHRDAGPRAPGHHGASPDTGCVSKSHRGACRPEPT
jgi:hypothetical protein